MKNYYEILGVSLTATQDEIKARFRYLASAYHPDKFAGEDYKKKAEEDFKEINEAYQVLSDPIKRSNYDEWSRNQSQYESKQNDYQNDSSKTSHTDQENEQKAKNQEHATNTSWSQEDSFYKQPDHDSEQMPSNTPVMESKPGPAGWLPVWIKAVTKPYEQTFVDITEHPDVSSKTAYIWVFIAGTVSGIIQAFATTIRMASGVGSPFQQIPGLEEYFPQAANGGGSVGVSLIGGLCASPLAGLFSVLFFALFVAIIQWIAKLFGGTGTYEKLLYALAAITVPFTIVSSLFILLGVIPYVGICTGVISFGLAIYSLVLQIMAVKAVNRFGWGQATGSVFLPGCVIFIFCACVVFGGLMLLGPVIGQTFEGINNFAP